MSNGIQGSTIDEDMGNWDDVSTAPPPKQAPNYYYAKITETKVEATKDGKPGIRIGVTLEKAYDADGPEVTTRYAIGSKLGVHKDAAFRVKQLCQSADVAPPARNGNEHLIAFCDELLGKPVIVKTKIRRYEDPAAKGSWKEAVDIDSFDTEASIAAARAPKDGSGATVTESQPAGNRRRRPAAA